MSLIYFEIFVRVVLDIFMLKLVVGVCVGFVNGEFIVNLMVGEMENLILDLVIVGIVDVMFMIEV